MRFNIDPSDFRNVQVKYEGGTWQGRCVSPMYDGNWVHFRDFHDTEPRLTIVMSFFRPIFVSHGKLLAEEREKITKRIQEINAEKRP